MKYLVLTLASSDPGDSDIVSFSSLRDVEEHIRWSARGGAHKIIVFKKMEGERTDIGGGSVWAPEDEVFGARLKEFAGQRSRFDK
jgi:hypothetical protein